MVLVELLHRDRDQSKFSTDLPFSSPYMLMGDTEDHNASAYELELDALNVCVLRANEILRSVSNAIAQQPQFTKCRQWITLEPVIFFGSEYCRRQRDSQIATNRNVPG